MKNSPTLFISKSSDGHMGILAEKNRERYFAKIGIDAKKIVDIAVDHTDKVKIADKKDTGKFFEGYDAVITKEKGVYLALTTADCIPIALFDPESGSAGLIHAGWRGLVNRIIPKTIKEMGKKLGAKTSTMEVYVGPHICRKHYEVKSDVSTKFAKYKKALIKERGKTFLDLGSVAAIQLVGSGVKKENIKVDGTCNFENSDYFSFRRGNAKNRNLYLMAIEESTT